MNPMSNKLIRALRYQVDCQLTQHKLEDRVYIEDAVHQQADTVRVVLGCGRDQWFEWNFPTLDIDYKDVPDLDFAPMMTELRKAMGEKP